ncbi:unnamed protein product [Angiostrongylus costaricensis]|uniref:Arf-GAP domain-containing protein n=1 Tax=Angiostrongylus costaricensis TaxID=334426 RepID=A0A0R3PWJ0_ANGCS|nr:unnamed protein product [Angiostrongylus costaricensis]
MLRRGKLDGKKAEQERLQNILLELLKEDENKYCADCQAKTPRWAAWNLGVFICIRCAGIHRNLGVHISKVRSVNLDSWTAEQVQSMRVMGNEKARKVYEHSLPDHFRRSMTDHQMEQFIRAKYEQKRYMLNGFVYPQIDINDLPKPGQVVNKQKNPPQALRTSPNVRVPGVSTTTKSEAAIVNDLLDFSSPTSSFSHDNEIGSLAGDLGTLSLSNDQNGQANKTAELDDTFGSFASAPIIDNAMVAGKSDQMSLDDDEKCSAVCSRASDNLMSLSTADALRDEKKSNADILSLFGDQKKGVAPSIVPVGGFAAFGLKAASPPQQMMGINAPPPTVENPTFTGGPAMSVGFASPVPGQQSFMTRDGLPNPFEHPRVGGVMQFSSGFSTSVKPPVPQQPSSPSYSSRANNAFADLSLGKVSTLYIFSY